MSRPSSEVLDELIKALRKANYLNLAKNIKEGVADVSPKMLEYYKTLAGDIPPQAIDEPSRKLAVKGWHATAEGPSRAKSIEKIEPRLHFGTETAAFDRLSKSGRYPEKARHVPIEAEFDNPYTNIVSDDRANDREFQEELIDKGYDAIPYINNVEHPESISWVALDPKKVKAKHEAAPAAVYQEDLAPEEWGDWKDVEKVRTRNFKREAAERETQREALDLYYSGNPKIKKVEIESPNPRWEDELGGLALPVALGGMGRNRREDDPDQFSKDVIREFGKFVGAKKRKRPEEKSWWRNFAESFGQDIAEPFAEPATEMFGGMVEEDPIRFSKGLGLAALGTVLPIKAAGKLIPKRILSLIEKAGGSGIKRAGNIVSWINKEGEKQTADVTQRFGPRNVNLAPRQTGLSPRQVNEAPRQLGEDVKSRAADAVGLSSEELARPGTYYRVGKSGEPTYLGKKVDAGGAGGTIIELKPGKMPEIYQGSGKASDLERFNKSATGQDVIDRLRSERGAVGSAGAPPPKKGKARQTIRAAQIPEVALPGRFKLNNRVGPKMISFPSDFDKAAYTLASQKKPNADLIAELQAQTGFSEDTILQHGIKVKSRVDKLNASGQRLKLPVRSVQVIEEAEKEPLWKGVLGLPREYKFSVDLPALRQSFKPTLLHPFKSGLPALKESLGSFSEKGYREALERLTEESPVYDLLDTATALGPKKSKELFPNIEALQKTAGGKGDLYEYFTGSSLGERVPGLGELPKMSKRMYDVYQRTIRGKELERLAGKSEKSIKELASEEGSDLANMVRLTNERTGFGPLGRFEPAAENISYAFTAPRNTMAKLQFYNPLNYVPEKYLPEGLVKKGLGGRYGSDVAYRDMLADQAKLAALYGTGYAGAKALESQGADVEATANPLDTDFGVRFGNYRPDIFGGEKGLMTTPSRMLFPEGRISAKGQNYRGDPSYEAGKFLRYRLSPGIPAMTYDAIMGYEPDYDERLNAIGEDISAPYAEGTLGSEIPLMNQPYGRWATEQFTPAYPEDVYDAFKTAGPAAGIASIPLGALGMGAASYEAGVGSPYRPPRKSIRIEKGKAGKKKKKGGYQNVVG